MGKRIVLFLIALCNWCLGAYSQTSKVITLSYDKNDFKYEYNIHI